ncbi:unnamed protein product [Ilex paraguariensis]|uniref:MAPK kinase substrate protein n=1 Tax=Ilex paraguariensis TaxID=185542 RepID=A0ABC8SA29_9AQUA
MAGSSGLVWDDKLFSGELKQIRPKNEEDTTKTMQRSRSDGNKAYRSMNVAPAADPPSPKVSSCGMCGMFGKRATGQKRRTGHRKS